MSKGTIFKQLDIFGCMLHCSGCGHTVFAVLTDFQGFWAHENREASMPDMKSFENIEKLPSHV